MDIKLEKLAKLAVEVGANVQEGQYVVINGDVKIASFLQLLAKLAYEKGAKEVFVNYSDEQLNLLDYTYLNEEQLKDIPLWKKEKMKDQLMKDCVRISVNTINPSLYSTISPEKMNAESMEMRKVMMELRKDAPDHNTQWLGFCLPTEEWAEVVFKGDSEAFSKLNEVFFEVLSIDDTNDPVALWKEHVQEILRHRQVLTDYAFKTLVFKNSLGTDVHIGLVEDHQWCGGAEFSDTGVAYTPNLPTEEIFCIPHKDRVNGKIVATKPLNVMGKLVEDFWFEFKDGLVVDYDARVNKEVLTMLMDMDEGAKRLGEVALIANSSKISAKNVLFYTTLFDENASCHVALGQCYGSNFKDVTLTKEDKEKMGGNFSAVHCDFMFGSADLEVIGITKENQEVLIMKDGEFVI